MDRRNESTEAHQFHSPVASKPKPPAQSMKPKPALPQKPPVANKPSHLVGTALSQNGPEPTSPLPVSSTTPAIPGKTDTGTNLSASEASSSPQNTSPRPKDPPPSLPLTFQKEPRVHRTPPPLPKNAPKVSAQHSLNRQKESHDTSGKSGKLNKSHDEMSSGTKIISSDSINDNSTCDSSDSTAIKDSEIENENFAFANLKSKFTASSENVSTSKDLPSVPIKPKPRIVDKSKPTINQSSVTDKVLSPQDTDKNSAVSFIKKGSHRKTGKSTFFANQECSGQEDTKASFHEAESSDKAIQFIKGKQSIADSTVWFNKSEETSTQSPEHSPIIPRKPSPKPPPKTNVACSPCLGSKSDKSEHFTFSSDKSPVNSQRFCAKIYDNKENLEGSGNTFLHHSSLNKYLKKDTEYSKAENTTEENIESNKDTVNVPDSAGTNFKHPGSPKPPPKPLPRKSTSSARPRPTPRKRPSLSTPSDETFDNSISDKDDHTDSSINGVQLHHHDTKSDVDHNKSDINRNKINGKLDAAVTSRIVTSETGEEEEYKVIDRSSVRSETHITDLEHETDNEPVILRKKIVRSDNIDDDEEITLEQLQSIEQFLESSDEEDHSHKFLSKAIPDKVDFEEKQIETNRNSENTCGSKKDSFEELLNDKSILEPSSLLNEIEDILTRSYKHSSLTRSSLTRSGSSPEKKSSPYLCVDFSSRQERSKSVDTEGLTPVRPPRPKKEQKRLRSMSQILYDSCGSDTESLPDLSQGRDEALNLANTSLTLGKAKPHPPKPKRHKLLKVQRSQSDVTVMKSVVDKQETGDIKSPKHKRLMSDAGTEGKMEESTKQSQVQKLRPSRKAPPPPAKPPARIASSKPANDLNKVVPVDERVKSMKLGSQNKPGNSKVSAIQDTAGSFYHCINDDEFEYSDGDHDYQDIPEGNEKHNILRTAENGNQTRDKTSVSPPKLPPRNLSNSQSFDNSSLSSHGPEFDSVITGGASSTEDMSISSGCFDQDIGSPGFKTPHIIRSSYPKTSSPYVKSKPQTGSDENVTSSVLVAGSSPLSDGMRPVSGCSAQSATDSWSGSGVMQSSSESEDDEDKISRKKDKKLLMIAQEVASSERVFVDVLKLLNVDFRVHISKATEKNGRPVIPNEILNRILDYLPQLQLFNEGLLKDLEDRVASWDEKKGLADIFVKKGPFLKLFSSYIRDFETITSTYDDALKKYPMFQAAAKEFEMSARCASLALKHYMLKPIQRIPQYRLLLQDYLKHLPEDSQEMKEMKVALAIVSEVANHANENMRHEDYVQKMLEIQRSLIGQFEVIKPGRIFLKEGELMKLSRKDMQPRYFFLFNDVLLYTTPVATGYRLNNVLPLAGMKVSVASQDEYKMEFSIISVQRSFTLHGNTLEERDDWIAALNSAIEENALKRNTFEAVRAGAQALLDKDFVLGHKAPLWIPDARVTMCMLCTCEFTVTWRRHHCRACGWVVCGNCSENKAPLRYLKYKPARVCEKCFKTLVTDKDKVDGEGDEEGKRQSQVKEEEESSSFLGLNGLFERVQKIRKSGRKEKKMSVRPERLKEVTATDQGASMSGYLQKWHKGKRWKKHWYLIKDKVLFTFRATQDTAATDSMVLLGYEVSRFTDYYEGVEADLLFQLSHANMTPVVFRTDSATATEKWVTVMRECTVA